MKRILIALLIAFVSASINAQNKVIRKQNDGTIIVNTKTLARDVKGYNGPTPVEIHIKGNKIVRVKPLTNYETRSYFEIVKSKFLPLWKGMTVKEASKAKVDAVTGATVSCNAVRENVRRGLEYYNKNK